MNTLQQARERYENKWGPRCTEALGLVIRYLEEQAGSSPVEPLPKVGEIWNAFIGYKEYTNLKVLRLEPVPHQGLTRVYFEGVSFPVAYPKTAGLNCLTGKVADASPEEPPLEPHVKSLITIIGDMPADLLPKRILTAYLNIPAKYRNKED